MIIFYTEWTIILRHAYQSVDNPVDTITPPFSKILCCVGFSLHFATSTSLSDRSDRHCIQHNNPPKVLKVPVVANKKLRDLQQGWSRNGNVVT